MAESIASALYTGINFLFVLSVEFMKSLTEYPNHWFFLSFICRYVKTPSSTINIYTRLTNINQFSHVPIPGDHTKA